MPQAAVYRELALHLARSQRWQDVSRGSLLRRARRTGDDETWMADRLERARESILTAWHDGRGEWGCTKQARERIASKLARVPLFAGG